MEPERRDRRKYLAIALALSLAWAGYLAMFGPKFESRGLETPPLTAADIPVPADYAWPLRDLEDRPGDLARFKGRAMVLNIWATWCPPCREEMPSIANLASNARLKEKGVAVVCVSTDESAEALRRFVKDKPWEMTILRATSTPPVFATDGIPATFLVAPDGRIVVAQVGAARWDDPSVVDFLEKLATPAR